MLQQATAVHYSPDQDSTTPALEREFYSVQDVARHLSLSRETVRRMFMHEPGVLRIGNGESLHKRGYMTLRIPRSVLNRVIARLSRR